MGPYTEILNSVITANTSDLVGAGIGTLPVDTEAWTALVRDSTITANVASVSSGGAHVELHFESDSGGEALDELLDDLAPVRFEPIFVTAQVGVTFGF